MADYMMALCAVVTVLGALWVHAKNDAERMARVETKVDLILQGLHISFAPVQEQGKEKP